MLRRPHSLIGAACTLALSLLTPVLSGAASSWIGVLRDSAGKLVSGATIELRPASGLTALKTTTDAEGGFMFGGLAAGDYQVSATWEGKTWTTARPVSVKDGIRLATVFQLSSPPSLEVQIASAQENPGQAGSSQQTPLPQSQAGEGGTQLSTQQVANLPLNQRDFTKLLALAGGTTTDTNGANNFTLQFAINGQRGVTAVFAMDGFYTADPELGGATFSNFNVNAIQEIQGQSGVMPPEIGEGAAGYTNVITKSGTDLLHGDAFEFVRNASFDARNFFDRRSPVSPGRIPPFQRNEFGFDLGGPVDLPGVYDGHGRTYFFGEYQGFRQELGTTQNLSVPTEAERQGFDTTAFPGDTLMVPVSPAIVPVLDGYPLPNDPGGPFGNRTYATSSKVGTTSDQFSVRIDHKISDKSQLLTRFSLDDTTGPLTDPNQTAINPSFALTFLDNQRNAGLRYTRTLSPNTVLETTLSYLRSTPSFVPLNTTQPALNFGDGLFSAFNSTGGTRTESFGNLAQVRQTLQWTHGPHAFEAGFEWRGNRDATIFGITPSGSYTFGGGPAYSPVSIASASGEHNIQPGDPLPDSLTGLLTATPFSYTSWVASPGFPSGDHIDEAGDHRDAYNFYFQDTWKAASRLTVTYGLRYELNSVIRERNHLSSTVRIVGPNGQSRPYWEPGAHDIFLFYPQPPCDTDYRGWGPRLAVNWEATDKTSVHAGGSIVTLLPNLWQDNTLTGGIPMAFSPFITAVPGAPVPFQDSVTSYNVPPFYTPQGDLIFPTADSRAVPQNTQIDVERFENELAALSPGHQFHPLGVFGFEPNFRNGYIGTYSAGLEHAFGDLKVTADYVATVGIHLPSTIYPNSYAGASPGFAPFTDFNAAGQIVGGYSQEVLMSSRSHSTFQSLQASASKTSARWGLGFTANYTFSKSLDDTSSVLGPSITGAGNAQLAIPQNPWNPGADKGPSTFDVSHILVFNVIEELPFDRINFLRPLGSHLTSGWQLLNISTLTSGLPFTVYSGIQQSGFGSAGTDRPDQVGRPVFSTSRAVREDYFGLGADNPDFFYIPIDIPGGTGPDQGTLGTLGRDTFRGPPYKDFDVALVKDTPLGRRGSTEAATLQFRAEFFNVFNLVNLGLPANVVRGTGFGEISQTNGTSRQIQLSVKLSY